jgi:WD40 repeat protein
VRGELTYRDFDVLVERAAQGAYQARVLQSPAGESGPLVFTRPVGEVELENFLLRIGRPRHGGTRKRDHPQTAAIKAFGGQLYEALFREELRECLLRSMSEAGSHGAGLRIRLRLSDCPELAMLPWEFLYDQRRNRFLCLSRRTPLVRYLELPDPPRPLTVSPPLRVLVMVSSPIDFPKLDVEGEWSKLHEALGELEDTGRVLVERLKVASLGALQQRLRRGDHHIFHFIGHGGFDPKLEDGVLILEDGSGRGRDVSGEELGGLLNDHDAMRLAVLNACEGARADATDPFAGTAQSLIQQGLPGVVAMQFEITDSAAITLAHSLYSAIAEGFPLDAALAEARKAIRYDGNLVEWATPVLHLRAPDGHIFDVAATPSTPSPPPANSRPGVHHKPPISDATPVGPTVPVGSGAVSRRNDADLAVREWSSIQLRTFEHPPTKGGPEARAIFDVALSPDGRWLATTSADNTARIWEAATGMLEHALAHHQRVGSVAFSPDGRWLATTSADNTARIWEAATGMLEHALAHHQRVGSVAFSPDSRWLATGGDAARMWEVATGKAQHTLTHESGAESVAFSPDGRWLATGGDAARMWEVATGKLRYLLHHKDPVMSVAFSPDGRLLVTASGETARIWEVASNNLQRAFTHPKPVFRRVRWHIFRPDPSNLLNAAFHPEGRWLATAAYSYPELTVQIWEVATGKVQHTVRRERPDLMVWTAPIAFTADGRLLATCTDANRAVLWALKAPSQMARTTRNPGQLGGKGPS